MLNNILEKQIHEALKQRIVINYNFEGLKEEEAIEYIQSRLSLARASKEIFDSNAIIDAYRSCTGSISRLNMIVTKALILGAQHKKTTIDTDIIMVAANEISLH